MANATQAAKSGGTAMASVVPQKSGFLSLIEAHRKTVLSTPFIFAAILIVLYIFAGNEFRRVLDFLSPSHLLGR